jgi:ABC-type transport system substrate-binding protein
MSLQVYRDVAVLKFLKGELDTLERLSSDQYVRFRNTPAWAPYLQEIPTMNVFGEVMDVTKPPFDDKRVRQAMNYALNKDDTVRLNNGRAVVAHGVLPPLMPGYDPTMRPYPYDPARARALLAAAGYPNGFDVTYTTTKDELAEKIAQSMQADLAAVGVRMQIQLLTFPAFLTAAGKHELPFAFIAWLMDFPDPWDFLEVNFHSKMIIPVNSMNSGNYANPEVDRLLDAGRAEQDRPKRLALYHRVEEILHDDCPWIWHYHAVVVEVIQPYVKGYKYHPVWMRNYRETWLDR